MPDVLPKPPNKLIWLRQYSQVSRQKNFLWYKRPQDLLMLVIIRVMHIFTTGTRGGNAHLD
jgi:hypothetical protein